MLTIPSAAPALPGNGGIDPVLAHQYFEEARAVSERDNGKLWGVLLSGPMIFADRETRAVVANQPDREGRLVKTGEVFTGVLPESVVIANTATDWAGVHWTMVGWPLPKGTLSRAVLMMHESYHRIQNTIGVVGGNPSNSHLDSLDGRLWLRLEMRALRAALLGAGDPRKKAIEDAILFRTYRRSLFAPAHDQERALEMNEGLAEYTGARLLPTAADSITYAARTLQFYDKQQGYVRSFAYATGPAYGILLDEMGAAWRKGLRDSDDLDVILQRSLSRKPLEPSRQEAEARSLDYDGAVVKAEERERDTNRRKRVAEYQARFIDGPHLVVPLTDKVSYGFDPNQLQSLDDSSTFYPTLRVTDDWGVLTVSMGALMTRENGKPIRVNLSAPFDIKGRPLQGDGWTLELGVGWTVKQGSRSGEFKLARRE
jgi:hypothetical protein